MDKANFQDLYLEERQSVCGEKAPFEHLFTGAVNGVLMPGYCTVSIITATMLQTSFGTILLM